MPVDLKNDGPSRDQRTRLKNLIARARDDISAFGSDLDFDAPVWDVTEYDRSRRSSGHKNKKLYFTTHAGGTSKSMNGRTALAEPFGGFVKAMVRIRQEVKAVNPQIHITFIRAARYLHDTLVLRDYDPTLLVAADFQVAANECRKREAETSCYRVGMILAEIANILNREGISRSRIDFRNPFSRVTFDDTRIGKEHEIRRSKKLPAQEALDALAQISNLVVTPADIVRMRAVELLVCGGWRINEALTLPENCEVTETVYEDGKPIFNGEGEPLVRYGIRYWPEKGADPRVKWMPTIMVDVAKRAISDIKIHTASARAVARFLEENLGQAYLPEPFRNRNHFSIDDLSTILNLSESSVLQWLQTRGISLEKKNGCRVLRRDSFEQALLVMQPRRKKDERLNISEYLFIANLYFCNEDKGINPCVVEIITDSRIDDFIQGRISGRGRTKSIFEKFGFSMPNGEPIHLITHQFRHWLNTLQQRGGMHQHEIARWFGRKEIGQNSAYDHQSGLELAELARAKLEAGNVRGNLAELHQRLDPIRRESFRETVIATAHTTDIGLCINDWSLVPCPSHGSCADCGDHLVEKGNSQQKARAEVLLEENKWLLKRVSLECDEGTYGASNHLTHARSVVSGLTEILEIHSNPEIPDGTLVHVDPSKANPYPPLPLERGIDEP